jgi:pyruvate formate lyase activating enzyme
MDVKAPPKKYAEATGVPVDVKKIKKSIDLIKNSGKNYEFRTTVVPGLLDYKEIKEIAEWIGPADSYFLQQFSPQTTLDKAYSKKKPYSPWKLNKMKKSVEKKFKTCGVRA